MDEEFWKTKWASDQIAFHEGRPNSLLVKHLASLSLDAGARIFLPLCGKSRDIAWLLSRGYRVAGAELSELAVEQLFDELEVEAVRARAGTLTHYRARDVDLDVFQGDIFALSADALGRVDAVYDRAALVALPEAARRRYAASLTDMSSAARQLLICFEYDQSLMDGPPFSVGSEEVHRLYGAGFALDRLESASVNGGLKGVPAIEAIWRLLPRTAR